MSKEKEEKKPKKWDVVNHEFLKTLKEQGQNIAVAITDPTQALIVVPQNLTLATVGTLDLENLLTQSTKKGSFECSDNVCINHLDVSLRNQLLKTYTHEHILKSLKLHISVRGTYQPEFKGKEFNPNESSTYVNKKGETPLYLDVRADTQKELKEGIESLKTMFDGCLKVEIYPPECHGEDELFASYILGKDNANINYIKKKTQVTIELKGKGSLDQYNGLFIQ